MKKRFLVFVIILLGIGLFFWVKRSRNASRDLVLYGNVDIREVNLGFRVSGRIKEMLKDEGDAVKVGEIIAQLDDEPYQKEAEEARAQVSSLKAKLNLMETGYRTEEIVQARAQEKEQEASLENARLEFERQKNLLAKKVSSQQEFDVTKSRFDEAQARLKSAQANLERLETGYRNEEIEQAKADFARAEAALATALIRVEDTKIKAPAGGVIITRAQEPGAIVQAGVTVLTLSLQDPVWVRAYVHEPELGHIHSGMKAEITTDSRPDKPYIGTVGYISPRAEFTPKNVETEKLRTSLVYRLRITVGNPDNGLRQGMPVTVRLMESSNDAKP